MRVRERENSREKRWREGEKEGRGVRDAYFSIKRIDRQQIERESRWRHCGEGGGRVGGGV